MRARTLKLGADHPDTLVSKNGLAWVYKEEARYHEAERSSRRWCSPGRPSSGPTTPTR